MRNVVLTLVGLNAAICTGRAHAEPPRRIAKVTAPDLVAPSSNERQEALVGQADTNDDGRVTATELEGFVVRYVRRQIAARFARLDRNRDGVVTKSEVPTMNGARFARFDRDGDAKLVASELERALLPLALKRCHTVFWRLDKDRDGAITANERNVADERQARR